MEMTAYTAVVYCKHFIATMIYEAGVLFPPPYLEILEFTHKGLKSFQGFLEGLDVSCRKRMSALLDQIPETISSFVAVFGSHMVEADEEQYDTDEEYINGDGGFQMSVALLEYIKQVTHSFIETLKNMEESLNPDLQLEDEAVSSSSRCDSSGNKSKMVGLSDEYNKLKEDIVGNWVKNPIFSLVGMAGIGKTTLARKIFEDLDILEWFDCRAWVKVGREYKEEEVTRAILAQVDPDEHIMGGGSLEESLEESLEDKRYLIVLDDVWDIEFYDYLYTSFPDTRNGSRILLTTRKRIVAENVMLPSHLLNMRLLNREESWLLLCEKVFGEEPCPPKLEKAGEKIAEKCDGLPLTIITIADLLSSAPESLWIEVATYKKHQLFIDAYDEISKVLYPSYDDLNEDMKLCFLYMGVFPQNFRIQRSKLFNLWIAEKLIDYSDNLSDSESSALMSLQHLDFNSIVMVFQRSTSLSPVEDLERIKTCGLHSAWWHFCHSEARKKNFFFILDSYKDFLGEGIESQSRLSIHNNVLFAIREVYNSIEANCVSIAHSLLCFGPYNQYPVPVCVGLTLLKKLDALNIRFYEFPLEILELVRLRYLALTCNGLLPHSISTLQKLQFLIVHRHLSIKRYGACSYLPMEIWDMKKLKYLQVMGNDLPDLGNTSLQKLSTLLGVGNKSCSANVLRRTPDLNKLGIRIELTPDRSDPLCYLDHIRLLHHLKSFKCVVVNPKCMPEIVAPLCPLSDLPSSLQKLSLNGLGYPWEEMRKIASLPNLKVLKLQCNAFRGPKWKIKENGFKQLYFLLIEDMDLVQLKAMKSFECLKTLSIKHCYKLKKLRLNLHKIAFKIEVIDCNRLIEKEIKGALLKKSVGPKHLCFQSSWNS